MGTLLDAITSGTTIAAKDIAALQPHDKHGWTLMFDDLDKTLAAANQTFKFKDTTLTITPFQVAGAQVFVTNNTPNLPGTNEAVCKELLSEKNLGKEKFWMGEELRGRTKGPGLLIVLKEKREMSSVSVTLKNMANYVVKFRAVQLSTSGPCSFCEQPHNESQCPLIMTIAAIDGVLRARPVVSDAHS